MVAHMERSELIVTLRAIERDHADAPLDATDIAARLRARLTEARAHEPDEECSVSLGDPLLHRLFVALCRRYGLEAFRRERQRRSSVSVLAPKSFCRQVLWPEYHALAQELERYLASETDRVIREAIDPAWPGGNGEQTPPERL